MLTLNLFSFYVLQFPHGDAHYEDNRTDVASAKIFWSLDQKNFISFKVFLYLVAPSVILFLTVP